eukprot:CAMPEP_0194047764 /NCGR_PEP_ID=MMETSP0009_2-20130614/25433_1 /TAXON_ID=210454 /ORGANISM="Grammatophora oceanica, Strain CCMP 410" /LENGTH=35 /DNA_ID= /DNA_START= /DNA_END= /DNA_ORIENTATION=
MMKSDDGKGTLYVESYFLIRSFDDDDDDDDDDGDG